MELTEDMKKKAIYAFITSMEKSGANAAVSQYFLAMDTALTDALTSVLADLAEPALFKEGDRVEVIGDLEDVEGLSKGMTGTVVFYQTVERDVTDTKVEIDGISTGRGSFWFYGAKELRKIA